MSDLHLALLLLAAVLLVLLIGYNKWQERRALERLDSTLRSGVGDALLEPVPLETSPDTNREEIVLTARSPFQGAKVANISPAVADELHLDSQTEGVVVIQLDDGSTAASVGFQKGDIILAVNNQKIGKTSDLDKASKVASRLWRIVVVRGGQQINVTLGG